MNQRIQELAEQAGFCHDINNGIYLCAPMHMEKFAELIVEECCRALNPMLRDMISRGQGVDLIRQHFGVEE